jgi:hypothetical protein
MKKFALVILLLSGSAAYATDSILVSFSAWGDLTTADPQHAATDRGWIYIGWTNGFFQSYPSGELSRYTELHGCLSKMGLVQALAMIDKYYKDHPEKWDHALGEQMLEALTVAGGPCEGKNPLKREVVTK